MDESNNKASHRTQGSKQLELTLVEVTEVIKTGFGRGDR
jgi:hypothetical protein